MLCSKPSQKVSANLLKVNTPPNPIIVKINSFSMTSITANQLKLLVYRYLQDSGFEHSVLVFGDEAGIKSNDGSWVPSGALQMLVQKRLESLKMRTNIINVDSDSDEDFSALIMKDVAEKRKLDNTANAPGRQSFSRRPRSKSRRRKREEFCKLKERMEHQYRQGISQYDDTSECITVDDNFKKFNVKNGLLPGAKRLDSLHFRSSNMIKLQEHSREVSCCAWSAWGPRDCTLASGSQDATARIWTIAEGRSRSTLGIDPLSVHVLQHPKGVTALDWNPEGTRLATASQDGKARVWNRNGELLDTLNRHNGPILSLKWNKRGDYILTGSSDNTAAVWDIDEQSEESFKFHSGPIIDVDWMDDYTFATCSSDHMIYVCRVWKKHAIKRFSGHSGEVNCVKWDSSGELLASCSVDKTIKIWNMNQGKYVHDLTGHAEAIYTMRWSPVRPDTSNPNRAPLLASASYDSTVKLWNVEQGKCICTLEGHSDAVFAVAFSPDGEYLATGSLDRSLHIWYLKERKIICTQPVMEFQVYAGTSKVIKLLFGPAAVRLLFWRSGNMAVYEGCKVNRGPHRGIPNFEML